MAYTNIKTEIDGKIYTNILREITGDILNEVLKKMVDSLGKGYRYMGILDPDGSAPSGDENMFMIATEGGYYPAVSDDIPSGITICTFAEGSQGRETILNLDELFSNNHNWGGDNTFSSQLKVAFESLIDLNSDENLQDMLNALMPRVLTAVENHIATFDAYGRAKDSGVSVDDLAKKDGISEKLVSGSAAGVLSPSAIEELFLFQRTANGAGGTGAAVFQAIKGNSIVWNQLALNNLSEQIVNGITYKVTNGVITMSGTATAQGTRSLRDTVPTYGHKFIVLASNWDGAGVNAWRLSNSTSSQYFYENTIFTPVTDTFSFGIFVPNGYTFDSPLITSVMVIDLTLMFGAGKEPSSVEEFKALYPLPFYSRNNGAIKNNCATGMVTDGFNLWDEEWEQGRIDTTTGANVVTDTQIRSKNYIPVFGGQTYYARIPSTYPMWVLCYDANRNVIETPNIGGSSTANNATNVENYAFTVPEKCAYIRFYLTTSYGTTYKNDICINLSGARNGQYEPHWSDTLALPITTATGKLNGEGESVVLSPTGIPSLGAIANKYIAEKGMLTKYDKQLGVYVFTGEESWGAYGSSGASAITIAELGGKTYDAAATPNILTDVHLAVNNRNTIYTGGVGIAINGNTIYVSDSTKVSAGMQLIYELATPQLYVLDTPVPVVARVDEDGTQTILPQGVDESGVPMTAPFKASIQYPVKLGVAPIGQQSLVNLLERMKSAGKIASYTMFWDAATGAYDFTIS